MTNVSKQSLSAIRSPSAPAREWQPVAGFTWELFLIALGWVIAFSTIPVVISRVSRGAYPSTLTWLLFWIYFGLTYKLTAWLSDKYRDRQRRILIGAQELLEGDTRPPILYLRAFKDDETTSRLLNLSSEEQELAVTMREIGPFIAFGEPGEVSPEPGAARMYVPQDNWQGVVANLMASARLVVGRIANSEGFWWEMSTAVQLVRPENLLLLLPNNKEEYEEFRLRAKRVFPCELPDHQFKAKGSAISTSHISSEGYLYFGSDWTPHLQKFTWAPLRQNYWIPGVAIFKSALRPVYEQLGVEWKRPPFQPLMILAVVMLCLFGIFTLYVGAMQLVKLWELIR